MKLRLSTDWRNGFSPEILQDGIISDSEMQKAWKKIAEHYKPPFLEVDVVGGTIGDGVTVDGR